MTDETRFSHDFSQEELFWLRQALRNRIAVLESRPWVDDSQAAWLKSFHDSVGGEQPTNYGYDGE